MSIPPPPPLPPGTVVLQDRLSPPPMPAGRSAPPVLGSSLNGRGKIPAAPSMPFGGSSVPQHQGYAATNGRSGGMGVPIPPPLPPGTVVPQSRPLPPAMPPNTMGVAGVGAGGVGVVPGGIAGVGAGMAMMPTAALPPPRPVRERPANGQDVQFPTKVKYFESAEDLPGEKEKGILRLRKGQMAAIYKTDDPHWWLGKIGDDVGWIASDSLQEIDSQAAGRQQHRVSEDANPRTWDSKKEGQMTAGEMDMDKTDFGMTQDTTFDHHGSKITAFFIQVSGVRKNVKKQGDIWVVAKTLKAFNRLRVAWDEDYGSASIPVEPPPARWTDCSEADWISVKGAALRKFLEEVKQWPNLKHSQDLKHFLTTDRVNLSGGMISKKTMKPYLDAWVKTSSEPSWTLALKPIPSKDRATAPKEKGKVDKGKKAPIPGLRAGDETFGQLTSRRPKLRRSGVFAQLSALAAVTKQEAQLETGRRGWTQAGIKLQLLTQGGDACSLKKRSERNIYQKYYADDGYDDSSETTPRGGAGGSFDAGGGVAGSRALSSRGSYNQMKFHMRYNLEKIIYGRMENLSKENNTKYAVYAKQKEQEKLKKDGGVVDIHKRGIGSGIQGERHKKSHMFHLEAIAERLDKITKVNELQSKQETTLDRCQYLSRVPGRFTMPLAAQLMAMDELTREDLEHFLQHVGEGSRPKLERMKELDSFLEDKRVRCHQLMALLDRMHTPDERLLVMLTCCARLTDAIEADDQGLFRELEMSNIDKLNQKRARLAVDVLVAEAQAEDASRASRKAAREVHADVRRARKALGFLSKAVEKIRSGTIKADMFEELKERLEAAADAAYEEYCDAVKDARPANEYAEQAVTLMENARMLHEDLDSLGTGVKDRVKVIHHNEGGMMEPADTEETLLVSALEVLLTISCNAQELATRAADNARLDMQTALEEVAKAEKIIRRVELEERRARNECDQVEGTFEEDKYDDSLDGGSLMEGRPRHRGSSVMAKIMPGYEDLDSGNGCPFGEWADEMREYSIDNLEKFRKGGKYRLHLDKAVFKGTEDIMMMATLLSKVQLLRDLKSLKAEAKVEEQKRQESLMQSNSKRRRRTSTKNAVTAPEASSRPARHAPLRQQSSLSPANAVPPRRGAPLRQQSSLGPGDAAGESMLRKSRGRRRSTAYSKDGRGRPMGELEDNLEEEEDEDDEDEDDEENEDADENGGGSDEDVSDVSSEDSVFGSDLEGDDEDLDRLRKKAGRRGSAAMRLARGSMAPRGGGGGDASGRGPPTYNVSGRDGSAEGTTRRNDRMRKQLINATLGKRRSIGTKSLAKGLAPLTPRHAVGTARRGSGSAGGGGPERGGHFGFSHAEGVEEDEDDHPR